MRPGSGRQRSNGQPEEGCAPGREPSARQSCRPLPWSLTPFPPLPWISYLSKVASGYASAPVPTRKPPPPVWNPPPHLAVEAAQAPGCPAAAEAPATSAAAQAPAPSAASAPEPSAAEAPGPWAVPSSSGRLPPPKGGAGPVAPAVAGTPPAPKRWGSAGQFEAPRGSRGGGGGKFGQRSDRRGHFIEEVAQRVVALQSGSSQGTGKGCGEKLPDENRGWWTRQSTGWWTWSP